MVRLVAKCNRKREVGLSLFCDRIQLRRLENVPSLGILGEGWCWLHALLWERVESKIDSFVFVRGDGNLYCFLAKSLMPRDDGVTNRRHARDLVGAVASANSEKWMREDRDVRFFPRVLIVRDRNRKIGLREPMV